MFYAMTHVSRSRVRVLGSTTGCTWPSVDRVRACALADETPALITEYSPGPSSAVAFIDWMIPTFRHDLLVAATPLIADQVAVVPGVVDTDREERGIVNTTRSVECLDVKGSLIAEWRTNRRGVRYPIVHTLKIDPEPARGLHIFRVRLVETWPIVSQDLRDVIERFEPTGVSFDLVG